MLTGVPQDAPEASVLPQALLTARDIAFLMYYYPLRGLGALFPSGLPRPMQSFIEATSRLVQARDFQNAKRKIAVMLQIPPADATQLARRYMANRVRAALFDFKKPAGQSGCITGRAHLESAMQPGKGAILVTLHCLAKREARGILRAAGIDFHPVVRGQNRNFQAHGRLLERFVQNRLVPLQWRNAGLLIIQNDPDAVMQMVRLLRGGGLLLISPDVIRSATARPLPFLNTIRPMSTGILDIARLTGCPVVPMWISTAQGECCIEFRAPLNFQFGGDREAARESNTALLLLALEEQLRAHPEQWEFWDRAV